MLLVVASLLASINQVRKRMRKVRAKFEEMCDCECDGLIGNVQKGSCTLYIKFIHTSYVQI